MHNQEYGDYSRVLRVPELRSPGVSHEIVSVAPPCVLNIHAPGKACLYVGMRGCWRLQFEGDRSEGILIEPGSAVAMDNGKPHFITALLPPSGAKGELSELLVGRLDWRHTIIQKVSTALIIMPASAEPHATIVGHIAGAVKADLTRARPDESLQRRFSEIFQIELVHYAQARLERVGPIPEVVRHDAPLLRAWTAFLSDPSGRWTIKALADAAGVSRTTFAVRFARAVGDTPISAVRWLRVNYAAEMLQLTRAPIAEIAVTVGYGSDIALMRAFRRQFGVTPAQWRKDHLTTAATDKLGLDKKGLFRDLDRKS